MPEKGKSSYYDLDGARSSKKSFSKNKDKNWKNHLLDDDDDDYSDEPLPEDFQGLEDADDGEDDF